MTKLELINERLIALKTVMFLSEHITHLTVRKHAVKSLEVKLAIQKTISDVVILRKHYETRTEKFEKALEIIGGFLELSVEE